MPPDFLIRGMFIFSSPTVVAILTFILTVSPILAVQAVQMATDAGKQDTSNDLFKLLGSTLLSGIVAFFTSRVAQAKLAGAQEEKVEDMRRELSEMRDDNSELSSALKAHVTSTQYRYEELLLRFSAKTSDLLVSQGRVEERVEHIKEMLTSQNEQIMRLIERGNKSSSI